MKYLRKRFSVPVGNINFGKGCHNCRHKNSITCEECTHGYTKWQPLPKSDGTTCLYICQEHGLGIIEKDGRKYCSKCKGLIK